MLSFNSQSLNAKFDELLLFTETLNQNNCCLSAICIQETWFDDISDTSRFNLEGYNLISQGKHCSEKGGLLIYLRNSLSHKVLKLSEKSNIWEGQFIEINNNKMPQKIVIGNLYRPPRDLNANYETFTKELEPVLSNLQRQNNEVVIAGDFNIDLLKLNSKIVFTDFFDSITSFSFFPQITFPTRIQSSATLIDNVLYKLHQTDRLPTAGILTKKLSDHLAYFITLPNQKNYQPVPKFTQVRSRSENDYVNFQGEIRNTNIFDKLNKDLTTDPNINADLIHNILTTAINKHLPTKTVRYNKHKHKKSYWITYGIIKSIAHRDKMYTEY